MRSVFCSTVAAFACAGICAPASAQLQTPPRPAAPKLSAADLAQINATIDRFGFDMVTVGAPGNRSWIESERFLPNGWTPNHIDDRGRVDYEFRVLRTEVVQTQYVDFVRAFRPYWLSIAGIPGAIETGSDNDSSFSSRGISIFGGFDVDPRYNTSAVTISWRNAARYANWLHNGAPTDPGAITWDTFHTGAYTFTEESFGSNIRGNPITRNEGARFWLPSLDELLKAAYYDPNRYGEGEDGYWFYPHSSNEEPVRGEPGEGDYGAPDINGDGWIDTWEALAAAQHPDTVSPWGLLDVLGTSEEWVETPYQLVREQAGGELLPTSNRVTIGTGFYGIDEWSAHLATSGGQAFRIATVVPAPTGASLLLLPAFGLAARRRR